MQVFPKLTALWIEATQSKSAEFQEQFRPQTMKVWEDMREGRKGSDSQHGCRACAWQLLLSVLLCSLSRIRRVGYENSE